MKRTGEILRTGTGGENIRAGTGGERIRTQADGEDRTKRQIPAERQNSAQAQNSAEAQNRPEAQNIPEQKQFDKPEIFLRDRAGLWGRRGKDLPPFAAVPLTEEQEWTEDGAAVLRAAVSLLIPEGMRRIAGFYQLQRRSFLQYCQGELLPWARAEARCAMAHSVPVPCFRAELICQETYRSERLWSLYTQVWDNAGPGASSLRRWGDIWDLHALRPVPAADFFPSRDRWKRRVLSAAEAAFTEREERGLARLRPDWRRRLRRTWNPRNCYVTTDGLVFFWPMYALGPAAEGIPTFTLPFEEAGLQEQDER